MVVQELCPKDISLQSVLKVGGESTIYQAELKTSTDNRPIAVKLYNNQPESYQHFKRELFVLSMATHPNIPSTFGFFKVDGQLAIALELLHGRSLSETLFIRGQKQEALHYVELSHIATCLLNVLDYLHSGLNSTIEPIVHGDLSPQNIFLCDDGRIVVLDFGASHLECQPPSAAPFGKLKYLAPERLAGIPATVSSDLYALGAILFEAMTLRPFKGARYRSEFALLQKRLGSENFGSFLAIRGCLAPSPHLRPKSARRLLPLFRSQTSFDSWSITNF